MATQLDTTPYWSISASFPTQPRLDHNVTADVVVVGGGITGLTAAFLLAETGKTVVLLERARCATVDTGHTTAHATMVTDTRLGELASRFGHSHAQAIWDAGLAAIAEIDHLVRKNDLDAKLERIDGYLHLAAGDLNSSMPYPSLVWPASDLPGRFAYIPARISLD